MTKEENIMYAKSKLQDNIYKSAKLEGINLSIKDVIDLLNNINNVNLSIMDTLKLKGLKDAWEFVLNTIDDDLTIDYIKKIHFGICECQGITPLGEFRDKGVGITGTSYRPKLPNECDYDKELNEIMNISEKLDRCITLFLWIQRSQMFLDGNKRVANLVANKEMIKNGMGIIAVPVEKIGEYFTKLIKFYETNDYTEIKEWIYNNCMDGVD